MSFILSSLIFIPLVAAGLLLFIPARFEKGIKITALLASLALLALSVEAYVQFQASPDSGNTIQGYQFVEKLRWITLPLGSLGKLQINYFLGTDGISISMVLLTGIIGFIGVLSSWNIKEKVKGYFALYLLLLGSIMGCFVALDFFLFYLFFEFMLLPMYFLIGMWGGPRREYAAIKFFLYTLIGSLFILVVMIGLYSSVIDPQATAWQLGLLADGVPASQAVITQVQEMLQAGKIPTENLVRTFNIPDMLDSSNFIPESLLHTEVGKLLFGYPIRLVAFLLLFAGFAIKMPVVPVHTWLPDAHVEAPTPISVILAAVLLKVGAYGLLRIVFPVFPDGALHFAVFIGSLGVLSIIYGAFCALAMNDLKKMIAYSSVSHMGFVLLGLASFTIEGANGAVYQMFSHGLISAMLFLVVGVIYDRYHSRMIQHFRGLAAIMPAFTVLVVISFFASLGLPGFSGFIAELLVLLGAFTSASASGILPRWLTVVAVIGLLLGAAYYLWALQRIFFGKKWIHPDIVAEPDLKRDVSRRELLMLVPLAILVFAFGIFPSLLLDKISPDIAIFVTELLAKR